MNLNNKIIFKRNQIENILNNTLDSDRNFLSYGHLRLFLLVSICYTYTLSTT